MHLPPEGSAGIFLKTDHSSEGSSCFHFQHPEPKSPPKKFFFFSIYLFGYVRSELRHSDSKVASHGIFRCSAQTLELWCSSSVACGILPPPPSTPARA